jgi:hypothetical protein
LAQIKPREIASPRSSPDNFAFFIAFTNFLKTLLNSDDIPPAAPPTNAIFLAELRNVYA